MQGIRILGGHIAHNTVETASDRAPADAFRSSALRLLKVPLVPFSEILLRGGRVCNGKGCSCLSLASFSASTGSKAHDAAGLAGCMQSTWAAHREGRHAGLSGGRGGGRLDRGPGPGLGRACTHCAERRDARRVRRLLCTIRDVLYRARCLYYHNRSRSQQQAVAATCCDYGSDARLLTACAGRLVLAAGRPRGTTKRAGSYNSMDAGRWVWLWMWREGLIANEAPGPKAWACISRSQKKLLGVSSAEACSVSGTQCHANDREAAARHARQSIVSIRAAACPPPCNVYRL